MEMLLGYISWQELERLKGVYDLFVFEHLDNDNIYTIIQYLKENNINVIESIICEYLDLFCIDAKEFIQKFERLKKKYSESLSHFLLTKIDILEEMY